MRRSLSGWMRRARARLSNEAFARFLGAIKELNAGRCSREQVRALLNPKP